MKTIADEMWEKHRRNGRAEDAASKNGASGSRYQFRPLTSRELAEGDFSLEWHVKRVLVQGQPTILGAPLKGLKTTTAADLALSLGTGKKFLGFFDVHKPVRVAMVSGESGKATIQETARRISAAKGVPLAEADVLWDFDLPCLTDVTDVAALCDGIAKREVKVLVLDPLFLCLLAGDLGAKLDAANMFQMGPVFRHFAREILAAGATPILLHHAPKHVPAGNPLELDQLAYGGVSEFSRQWLLLNRRDPYDANMPGSHRLWLGIGGSCGQSGLWGLDIEEGELQEDFTGRGWEVTVTPGGETIREGQVEKATARADVKAEVKAQRIQKDRAFLLLYLDRHDPARKGLVWTRVRNGMGWNNDRMAQAAQPLIDEGLVVELSLMDRGKQAKGIQRK
jgi:hypothetical protein